MANRLNQPMAKAAFVLVVVTVVASAQTPRPTYDIILRHGTIVDGTGDPGFRGAIGIRDGRLEVFRVGASTDDASGARAGRTIDDALNRLVNHRVLS